MKRIESSSLCRSLCIVCFLLLATASVFAQTKKEKSKRMVTAPAGQETPAKDVVIGHLQSRDTVVTISHGTKGSIYTVKTKDGKAIASNLNEKDFEEKFPVLFNQVKYGLAGNDAGLRKTPSEGPFPAEIGGRK